MGEIRIPLDAAGGDYDGTAGKGLVKATDYVPSDPRYRFCILNLIFNTPLAVTNATIETKNLAVGADPLDEGLLDLITFDPALPFTIYKQCCCWCIPWSHDLLFSTTGKTGDAFLLIDYDIRSPGS